MNLLLAVSPLSAEDVAAGMRVERELASVKAGHEGHSSINADLGRPVDALSQTLFELVLGALESD
jgi:hypothetical protein